MSQDEELAELRREIVTIRHVVFVAASAVLAALLILNVLILLGIPRFEKIFEDMLGSREKLPELTKLVVGYGRMADGILSIVVISCFTIMAWSVMNFTRRTSKFVMIAVTAAVLLVMHGTIVVLSLFLPLIQIIEGISSR